MQLPQSFEELSAKQFVRLAPLLFKEGNETLYQVKALQILSGLNKFRFCLLKPEIIERCLPYVTWVFEENNRIIQHLPHYRGYYSPTANFDNLKMKEFHFSELYYRQIISGEDEATINNLVAVLYRKPKHGYDKKRDPDGDIRTEFNHNESPFFTKKISRWPEAVKQAIFLWYDSCRQELINNNELVFKEPGHSYVSQFDTGLYGMMRSLAGEKLGPVEKVENMYVHTAMLELGLIKEEEKYFEEQLKM